MLASSQTCISMVHPRSSLTASGTNLGLVRRALHPGGCLQEEKSCANLPGQHAKLVYPTENQCGVSTGKQAPCEEKLEWRTVVAPIC